MMVVCYRFSGVETVFQGPVVPVSASERRERVEAGAHA
jgi:hypothetical protein